MKAILNDVPHSLLIQISHLFESDKGQVLVSLFIAIH